MGLDGNGPWDDRWLYDFDTYAEKFSTSTMTELVNEIREELAHYKRELEQVTKGIATAKKSLERWEVKLAERLAKEQAS